MRRHISDKFRTMKNFHKQNDYWRPCRPGTIRNVSDSKFRRDRRRLIIQAAMGSVVAGLGLYTGWFAINHHGRRRSEVADLMDHDQKVDVTQILFTCSDVMDNMDEYLTIVDVMENQLTVNQKVLLNNVNQHLKVCDLCTSMMDEAKNA